MKYQKKAEATGNLIGNKIADKITKISKNSQQTNSKTVKSENDEEVPKEDIYLQTKGRKLLMKLD